jgi:hypothetical protein
MVFKIRKLILKPRNLILIISPNNLTLLEVKKTKKEIKIINKIEKNENYFLGSSLLKNKLNEFLKLIQEKYYGEQINVVLNLPNFFIQKFNLPNLDNDKNLSIIESRIKEELPINIEKYFWRVYFNPNNYENVMVIFYEKEILDELTNNLLLNNFLPIELQPIFSSIISFLKEKYALAFDKSYLILNFFKNVLTTIIYENGLITNIFSEYIESINKKEIIDRIINSSLRSLNSPLDLIFILTDEDFELDFLLNKNIRIIDITKETGLSQFDIQALSIINPQNKAFLSEFSLNVYNLEKDIALYNTNNVLKLWLLISLILGIIINLSLSAIWFYFSKEKEKISAEIKLTSGYNLEELKDFIAKVKSRTLSLKIYQNLDILNSLKNYKIVSIEFNNQSAKIVIEESDNKKRESLLNYLKNNLKLNNINTEGNFININIDFQ